MTTSKAYRLVVFLVLILSAVGTPIASSSNGAAKPQIRNPLQSPVLGGLPDALSFTYSIPFQWLLPTAHQVTPQNTGSGAPITWTVAAEGGWFTAQPFSGTTPASFWITPTDFSTSTFKTYTGAVTVTVTDPPGSRFASLSRGGTDGSLHRIDLTLRVMPFSVLIFPVMRNYPPLPLLPNDLYYNKQWALEKVDAPRGWNYSTGKDILIAIVDTGADLDHPDLADKVRTDIDWDYIHDDNEADDDHGHGTHVSGIAAATTNNGIGVAGLGWEAKILPLKVISANNEGESEVLAQAIHYAADQGADVINMSLGGAEACPAHVQVEVDYAYEKGIVLVASSGNDEGHTENFPANCIHVLGIAATNSNDNRASYSNYGNHVSVAAPGSSIYSTLMGGGYGNKNGTSMATPYVAGLAALLRARFPSYTPDQIASAILDNAEDLGATGWDEYYGCGRIDAFQALSMGARGSSPVCLEGVGEQTTGARETPHDAPFVPGEIIVALRPGVDVESLSLRYGASAEFLPTLEAWRLRVPPGQEQTILAQLRADPDVAHADLNYLVFAQ